MIMPGGLCGDGEHRVPQPRERMEPAAVVAGLRPLHRVMQPGDPEAVLECALADRTPCLIAAVAAVDKQDLVGPDALLGQALRSEERRVGKECRARWAACP